MNYSLIPSRPGQWINADGTPTREFYRFILNLFNAAGGGKLTLADVEALAYTVSAREQDTPRVAAEARQLAALAPLPRTTDLEARVRVLELLQQSQAARPNQSDLERRLQALEAIQGAVSRLAEIERRLSLYDAGSYLFLGHH